MALRYSVLVVLALALVGSAACGSSDATPAGDGLTPRPRVSRTPRTTRTPAGQPSVTRTSTREEGTPTGTETPTPEGSETPTETPTETPRPSRTPGDPGEQYSGSPIDGGAIETAFYEAGFEVTSPDSGTAYPGMSRDGFTVELSKDDASATVVLFIYGSPEELANDWKAEIGSGPEPQEGVEPPGYATAWWNNNTVVLVTQSPGGELQQALLDAYLGLP